MGHFVVFEGLDGAGKSTQIRRLHEALMVRGAGGELVREPGGTPAGEDVRAIMFGPDAKPLHPLTWALLMSAARAQLVTDRIKPALMLGRIVLADRYWYSTLAYQGGGEGLDEGLIRRLSSTATQGIEPDLVIYLDLPPDQVAERKEQEEPNVLDGRPLDFHQRVWQAYARMAQADADRWCVFDATTSPEVLTRMIGETVFRKLGVAEASAP